MSSMLSSCTLEKTSARAYADARDVLKRADQARCKARAHPRTHTAPTRAKSPPRDEPFSEWFQPRPEESAEWAACQKVLEKGGMITSESFASPIQYEKKNRRTGKHNETRSADQTSTRSTNRLYAYYKPVGGSVERDFNAPCYPSERVEEPRDLSKTKLKLPRSLQRVRADYSRKSTPLPTPPASTGQSRRSSSHSQTGRRKAERPERGHQMGGISSTTWMANPSRRMFGGSGT